MFLFTSHKQLKTTKIIYWVSTVALALFILPGIFFINTPMAIEGIRHVGPFPEWFRLEVSIATFLGGLVIALPWFGSRLKEWAYVGIGIVYISALIAHLVVDGFVAVSIMPVVTFAILATSYITYHKLLDAREMKA